MGDRKIYKTPAFKMIMFHKAIDLNFKERTVLEMTFQSGEVKRFDLSSLFPKYPSLEALKDRDLFLSGKLMGGYGIMWNDDLDLEAETVFEDGETVQIMKSPCNIEAAEAVSSARAKAGISQKELASLSGINQSDISKIERGIANPSVNTLKRIASALGAELTISIS